MRIGGLCGLLGMAVLVGGGLACGSKSELIGPSTTGTGGTGGMTGTGGTGATGGSGGDGGSCRDLSAGIPGCFGGVTGDIVHGPEGPSCEGGLTCQGVSCCENNLVPGGTYPMGRSESGCDAFD